MNNSLKKASILLHQRGSLMVLILGAGLIFALSLIVYARNQDKAPGRGRDKIIEKGEDFDPPVEIIFVKSKIGEIETNKKFSAEEDWFRGLAITLLNNSAKSITHASISIRFPHPQENKLDFVVPLNYGESPIPSEDGQILPNTASAVLPGERIELRLPDEDYDNIRTTLNESGYPRSIKKIRIYVTMLGFSDGTLWIGGKTYKPDQNNPGRLIPLVKKTLRVPLIQHTVKPLWVGAMTKYIEPIDESVQAIVTP